MLSRRLSVSMFHGVIKSAVGHTEDGVIFTVDGAIFDGGCVTVALSFHFALGAESFVIPGLSDSGREYEVYGGTQHVDTSRDKKYDTPRRLSRLQNNLKISFDWKNWLLGGGKASHGSFS